MIKKDKKINVITEKLEDFWVNHSILICITLALVFSIAHYFKFILNVRDLVNSVINFSSIVIGVTGVFLTLIITLKESPIFERLKNFFPKISQTLYLLLRNQIFYGLIVVIISILINLLPPSPIKILSSIGVGVWFFFFWKMTLGSFYSVKILTDLVVKNFEVHERKTRI